jgi:hypothetical protein
LSKHSRNKSSPSKLVPQSRTANPCPIAKTLT